MLDAQETISVSSGSTPVPELCFLSQYLVSNGLISRDRVQKAALIAQNRHIRLADVLARRFGVSQHAIARAQAQHARTELINPLQDPPEMPLIHAYGPSRCLKHGIMPWRRIGGQTVFLTARPDVFANHAASLAHEFGPVRVAITTEDNITKTLTLRCKTMLVASAETRTPKHESCRRNPNTFRTLLYLAAFLFFVALITPQTLLAIVTGWAVITLVVTSVLKVSAAIMSARKDPPDTRHATSSQLPTISMLVPLYNETAIADHLIARLSELDYPRELLDVCLVLEADDLTTRKTLAQFTLPRCIRAITVPKGTIKTKPRALNYALDFARGDIIGVWDAEDAPEPDQLYQVAHAFAHAAPDIACLQGKLDYYNAERNWLTRCFTIEYATWFRVILPGLQRIGFAIPLGGTTLFFRRDILESLGGWDAHNVTEDADLGIRLARHGYRTELIDTVTFEEANGRLWPWIKQRSRWLKGYAITYGVHMRAPVQLWRDLGTRRFIGVQVLFLCTLSQFVLAPLLWTFWLPVFGIRHPLATVLPAPAIWMMAGLFTVSELISWGVALIGVRRAHKDWLFKWAPTLGLYFPLGALAAYKGLYELVSKPFYWDKTTHGVLLPKQPADPIRPPRQPAHPASDG